MREAAAVQFVMDAFGHLKGIGASKAAMPLLEKAGVKPDEGVTGLDKDFIEAARQRFWSRESQSDCDPIAAANFSRGVGTDWRTLTCA